jgi:hypothetical protein
MNSVTWINAVVSCFIAFFTGYAVWQRYRERKIVRPIITKIEKGDPGILCLTISNTAAYKIVVLKVYIKKWYLFKTHLKFRPPTDQEPTYGMRIAFARTRHVIFDEDFIKIDDPSEVSSKRKLKIFVKTTAGICNILYLCQRKIME